MEQREYDSIIQVLMNSGTPEDIAAMKKLWRKYHTYQGAIMHSPKEVKFTLNIDLDNKEWTLTPSQDNSR